MTAAQPLANNRLKRRKMRTRSALIRAAQTFVAAGKLNVPVLEITQAAAVGMGSFYNHFDSKEELFEAAVNEVLDDLGAILDKLTAEGEDPAETFARSFRLIGRLFRRRPEMCRVLLNSGLTLISADRGLAPRALRDISLAGRADRFTVDDPELALAVAGGALLGLASQRFLSAPLIRWALPCLGRLASPFGHTGRGLDCFGQRFVAVTRAVG